MEMINMSAAEPNWVAYVIMSRLLMDDMVRKSG